RIRNGRRNSGGSDVSRWHQTGECSPSNSLIPRWAEMIPGEVFPAPGEIVLNKDRDAISITVANTGDRPIQVGSHYHFAEANTALEFDRKAALGYRLDIPAGTAVRFEPGQSREISLIPYGGARIVYGFNQTVMGPLPAPSAGEKS